MKICNVTMSCLEFSISYTVSLGSGFTPSTVMSLMHSYLQFWGWKRKNHGWQFRVAALWAWHHMHRRTSSTYIETWCFHTPPPFLTSIKTRGQFITNPACQQNRQTEKHLQDIDIHQLGKLWTTAVLITEQATPEYVIFLESAGNGEHKEKHYDSETRSISANKWFRDWWFRW